MRQRLFRYPIDVLPTLQVLGVTAVQLIVYFFIEHIGVLVAAAVLLCVPCMVSVSITHNHFHVRVFRSSRLNTALEMLLFFQNGFTKGMWCSTHALHHKHYLSEASASDADPNSWRGRDGEKLPFWQYAVRFAVSHVRRLPNLPHRLKMGSGWSTRLIRLALVLALLYCFPMRFLLIFALPMVFTQIVTAAHSYHQHAGLETEDPYEASRNYEGPWFLYGIGYHTAHHLEPGRHWSTLKSLHAQIRDRIPAAGIGTSYFSRIAGCRRRRTPR